LRQLHFSSALLPDGWAIDVSICLAGEQIVRVERGVAAASDAEHIAGAAVAGVANAHCHAFQRAMAGLAERRGPDHDSFWTWREVMYRFLATVTPTDIEAIAAWTYLEMLEAGFTAVGEFHYLHNAPDGSPYADPAEMAGRIVAAAEATGIGLCLLPSFYAHGGCGGKAPTAGQKRFVSSPDGFASIIESTRRHIARVTGATIGIAPHSLRAVTDGELRALLTAHPSGPVHIHVAEQAKEVEECRAWSSARPVEWLLDNVPVDERWCLIHCTHMTTDETDRLAGSCAVVGLCPLTEANLGDGIFNGTRWVSANGSFAVGSDSGIRISLAEELRMLEYSQRLRDERRNRLGARGRSIGRFLFDMVTSGGAQALGLGIGALRAGCHADIVVLDCDHPALVGRKDDALLDAWIFATGEGVVRHVWARGHQVVRDGRHIARDRLYPRFAAVMTHLAEAL
jgi:formimidoylglutamate deiminase